MKKKIFAVSDVHGHATALREALDAACFDPSDPNHFLVCCGDCFDRGNENREVLRYLDGLPNKIVVRGNHEDSFLDAAARGSLTDIDCYNGMDGTIREIFGENAISESGELTLSGCPEFFRFIDEAVDYFETEHYVFVHGWVPFEVCNGRYIVPEKWRNAPRKRWKDSRWTEWYAAYQYNLILPDKTIVCGHRSTEYAQFFDSSRAHNATDIFYGNRLIVLDAATARSGRVNVAVLEDELLLPKLHTMKLRREMLMQIADGSKTVEMRLFDEKRKKIRAGDEIEFVWEHGSEKRVRTRVKGVYIYPDFFELTANFTSEELGFAGWDKSAICRYMDGIYDETDVMRHRVAAIAIQRIDG